MQIEAPPLSPTELAVLERALEQAGIGFGRELKRPVSRWRRVSAAEAVDGGVATPVGYARSPRSTPGATRA